MIPSKSDLCCLCARNGADCAEKKLIMSKLKYWIELTISNQREVPNMTDDDNSIAAGHYLPMVQIVLGKPIKIWYLCRSRARDGADCAEKKLAMSKLKYRIKLNDFQPSWSS